MEQYKSAMASIIATILRELKESPKGPNEVPVDTLREVYTPDEGENDPSLEELLEYVSTGTSDSITMVKSGGKHVVKVMDKVSLYLALYSLDYSMATAELLHWSDFERLIAHAMQENGLVTRNNTRFKDVKGSRHEIDVIAVDKLSKEHIIFLIDAKHWDFRTGGSVARVLEAANEQFNRAVMLGESLDALSALLFQMKLEWTRCVLVPMVVTLHAPPVQDFFIPIVSIMEFNNFIQEFAENMDFYKKKYVDNIPVQKRVDSP